MQTALPIDNDVLATALRPNAPDSATRNGVPLLPMRVGAMPVTPELVNQLRDELP